MVKEFKEFKEEIYEKINSLNNKIEIIINSDFAQS